MSELIIYVSFSLQTFFVNMNARQAKIGESSVSLVNITIRDLID